MARGEKPTKQKKSRLALVKSVVSRMAKKVTTRLRPAKRTEEERAARATEMRGQILDRTCTPKQTSLTNKSEIPASGRTTGSTNRTNDQGGKNGHTDQNRIWKHNRQ